MVRCLCFRAFIYFTNLLLYSDVFPRSAFGLCWTAVNCEFTSVGLLHPPHCVFQLPTDHHCPIPAGVSPPVLFFQLYCAVINRLTIFLLCERSVCFSDSLTLSILIVPFYVFSWFFFKNGICRRQPVAFHPSYNTHVNTMILTFAVAVH